MSNVAVITDSTAYLSEAIRKENNIEMVPLNVVFGNESFKEMEEITDLEFYKKVREGGELPKTSQPAVGLFADTYEKLAETYDEAVVITLSSKISGTYQSAVSAADMVEEINVHVVDSEISCAPQGYLALKAAEMSKEGADAKAIVEVLEQLKSQGLSAYFMVDDLSNLHRGGRLNSAQFVVGSLLKVKPVLHFVDGKIQPFEKIRTRKKAINRLLELLATEIDKDSKASITVIHANNEADANKIIEKLRGEYPNAKVDIGFFGPVIGTHLGEGSLGITWIVDQT